MTIYVTITTLHDRGVPYELAAAAPTTWFGAWLVGLELFLCDLLYRPDPRVRSWRVEAQDTA